MRAVVLQGGFGLDCVRLEERPDPTPAAGQVLLRMRAASLNYRDLSIARGEYDPSLKRTLVLGSDGVGEVVALGEGVTRFAVGERLCPLFVRGWYNGPPTRETPRSSLGGPVDGTFSELLCVAEDDLVRPPEHLSDVEAATLGVAGVTAYRALFEEAAAGPGHSTLVIGTGGVSTYAVILARSAGADALVVSRHAAKLERAKALGARNVIDSSLRPEWGLAVRDVTEGRGVDSVVEIGGAGTLAQSLRAVRAGGTILLIGAVAAAATAPSLVPVLMRNIRVQGVFVGPRASFEALVKELERSRAKPVVDRVFPLAEQRAAFDHLASGNAFGKVCLDLS
jgi:NADPH:quinone reductase-like Zn-dependent oxidoreductase